MLKLMMLITNGLTNRFSCCTNWDMVGQYNQQHGTVIIPAIAPKKMAIIHSSSKIANGEMLGQYIKCKMTIVKIKMMIGIV